MQCRVASNASVLFVSISARPRQHLDRDIALLCVRLDFVVRNLDLLLEKDAQWLKPILRRTDLMRTVVAEYVVIVDNEGSVRIARYLRSRTHS